MLETESQKQFYLDNKTTIELPGRNLVKLKDVYESAVYDDKGNLIDVKYDFSKITIEIVAQALSRICRFAGHLNYYYSVAEHCVNMSEILILKEHKLQAMGHEFPEIFSSDIPAPFKNIHPEMRRVINEFEAIVQFGMFRQFGIKYPLAKEVKDLDLQICANEAQQGGLKQFKWSKLGINKIEDFDCGFLPKPEDSYEMYLDRWYKIKDLMI